ncbi:hypothetical protein CesoFtcFv8_019136 [Champsocephalus esox]|uniref:Uncharacterized protein n=1 Tax=Champsocephalus esox TaxID=159716 RepID=A0AAN8GQH3_9TELE|nr:hypothetical protein CesoFtcFv8_019136 [Champsocephalus esox]
MLLSHRRFVVKKVWPTIPTPDSKFKGLFSVYGGDFQEWLGQTDKGIRLTPASFYSEECPSPLEVLSERPSLPFPPLPPKAFRALPSVRKEDDDVKTEPGDRELMDRGDPVLSEQSIATPHNLWLMDRIRAFNRNQVPCSQSYLLESQDTYVTLSANNQNIDELDDVLEETLPLEVLFASRKTVSYESHSDRGSVPQSSNSGRLSSQSSFEYPNHARMTKGPGYTCMAVADSEVSMDYSTMSRVEDFGKAVIYANDYKNEIPAFRSPFLPSHHRIDG